MTKKGNFVPAICPQCNASLDLNSDLETAFCTYCGTSLIVKDVIQKVKIVGNPTLKNYLKLGDRHYNNYDYKEAKDNYKHALEIEPDNWEAIYRYGVCIARTSTLGEFKINAFVKASKNALKIIKEDKKLKKEENEIKLRMAIDASNLVLDYTNLALNHYQEFKNLENSSNEYWARLLEIRECLIYTKNNLITEDVIEKVPKDFDGSDTIQWKKQILEEILLVIWQLCAVRVCNCVHTSNGTSSVKQAINPTLRAELVKEYDECLVEMRKINPTYKPDHILDRTGFTGCYVATAVYGSYDCPEVWTLRRYRDNVLDNNILGRTFIKIYYTISPKMIRIFGDNKNFIKFNKSILDKVVKKLNEKGFESTKYTDKY